MSVWNAHNIRRTRNAVAPAGRPINMYHTPCMYGVKNYLVPVTGDIEVLKWDCKYEELTCESEVYELCNIVMNEKNSVPPKDWSEAVELYLTVRSEIRDMLS